MECPEEERDRIKRIRDRFDKITGDLSEYGAEKLALINEEIHLMKSIGSLEAYTGYDKKTIKRWEEEDVLPFPVYYDESGMRWYRYDTVLFLEKHVLLYREFCSGIEEFKNLLHERWNS